MTPRKDHCPSSGEAVGLSGPALCGRWAKFNTGDHAAIRRQWANWLAHCGVNAANTYCRVCASRLIKQVRGNCLYPIHHIRER